MPKYEIDLWGDAPVHKTVTVEAATPAAAQLKAVMEAQNELKKSATMAGIDYEVEWSAFDYDLLDVNECVELAEKD